MRLFSCSEEQVAFTLKQKRTFESCQNGYKREPSLGCVRP